MPPSGFMVFITMAMFLMFTLYWLINVYILWAETYNAWWGTDPDDQQVSDVVNVLGNLQFLTRALMLILGDAVSLWRAYAILGRPRWLYILSTFIVSAEVALWIAIAVEFIKAKISLDSNILLTAVAVFIAAFVQLLSTLMIGYKTWLHWSDVREFVGPSNVRRSLAVLTVVIESGVALHSGSQSETLQAMYPTVVIVLVSARLAILERSINSAAAQSDVRFAIPPGGPSSEDDEPCSQPHRPRWLEEDHQDVPRRLDVSFGPSFALRSIVVAAKDEDENETPGEQTRSTDEAERDQARSRAPPSLSETDSASVTVAEVV
ncbi:hypothetical protein PENSPDRAFT_753999 [Peniophora sp. CONT]|nr:hypothetical protein PENSPDRAFT_753999 [Peniophora sp. CONT]